MLTKGDSEDSHLVLLAVRANAVNLRHRRVFKKVLVSVSWQHPLQTETQLMMDLKLRRGLVKGHQEMTVLI